jgi:hypothetical protein
MCRWEDNIKMSVKHIMCEVAGWIYVALGTNQWLSVVVT